MKTLVLNFLKFLLFLGVGLGILYLVYQNQNAAFQEDCSIKRIPEAECSLFLKVIRDFGTVNYFWILMMLLAFTVSNISRAIRWNMLIEPLGHRPRFINAFFCTIIGYFANLGLPRIGEVIRAGTLAQYEKIGAEKIMGTVVVERIIDVLSIVIVTIIGLLVEFDTISNFFSNSLLGEQADEEKGSNLLIILLGIFLFIALLLYLLRNRIQQLAFYQRLRKIFLGFVEGLQSIRLVKRPWLFLFHSVNIWVMYFAMTYLCFFSFEPTSHLSPAVGLTVFVFGAWGVVIPSPGGMGTYHFLAQTALGMYGVAGDDGFSWANISFFSIQLGCNISIGILGLLLLPIINRNYQPKHQMEVTSEST